MLLTFSHFRPLRCPLAQRAVSGNGTRPCRGPSANAVAVFPPCGAWTPPPRGRQWGTLQSTRQASDCAALWRLSCVSAAVWPKPNLLAAVAGVCWWDGTGEEAANTHVWRLCQREIRKNSDLFVLYFLLLKFRYKVELHCECCLSCKGVIKTPIPVGNGASTPRILLLFLKLIIKQTVIAWHSQHCSSWRLIPHPRCLSVIPWEKKKSLSHLIRLFGLIMVTGSQRPRSQQCHFASFYFRSLVLCFLISFGAFVYLESFTIRFSDICFLKKRSTLWNLICWWLTAVSCIKV